MIFVLLLACRPIPGGDDYASQEDLSWLSDDAVLEGDQPWEPGESRLTVNLFYEGGASHALPIDNIGVFYYVYEGTYFQTDSDGRLEGQTSERIVHGGGDWRGGGVHFEDGLRDFSSWSTLHLSVKSDVSGFEATRVGLTTEDGQFETPLVDWGFAAVGEWHTLTVPLDVIGTGLERTSVLLLLLGERPLLDDDRR